VTGARESEWFCRVSKIEIQGKVIFIFKLLLNHTGSSLTGVPSKYALVWGRERSCLFRVTRVVHAVSGAEGTTGPMGHGHMEMGIKIPGRMGEWEEVPGYRER
jgi:hypothetical protein